jgi:hypothetical protein
VRYLAAFVILLSGTLFAQEFSCPEGEADVMKYFVMAQENRANQFMSGTTNSIYTEVFPNRDFAQSGYWFWLKSAAGNGFDVKAFDKNHVYMRSTELVWTNNTTFKRFVHELPIAARCVPEGKPGPEIKVRDTTYQLASAEPATTETDATAEANATAVASNHDSTATNRLVRLADRKFVSLYTESLRPPSALP